MPETGSQAPAGYGGKGGMVADRQGGGDRTPPTAASRQGPAPALIILFGDADALRDQTEGGALLARRMPPYPRQAARAEGPAASGWR